jgi:TonB family protein
MFESWWAVALDLVWKETAVLAAAWAVNLLLRRAAAATRHTVWVLALGSVLALPLFETLLPAWQTAQVFRVSRAAAEAPAARVSGKTSISPATPAAMSRDALPGATFALWIAGVLLLARRWRAGNVQVKRMRTEALVVAGDDSIAQEAASAMGLSRRVLLLRSREEIVPLAAGLRAPMILLPASAGDWTGERLRVVLLHEMAHIKRNDCLTQALGELILCLCWFHPLVWLAMRRLRAERERACDDLVLHAGTKASDYAAHLLDLAKSLPPARLAAASVSMAAPGFESRLRAILDPRMNRAALTRRAAGIAGLVTAFLLLPLAAMRPQAADAGTVTGTVYDAAGARIPGAVVIAARTDGSRELKTTTDQEGHFTIGPLPSGETWQATIEAPGFAPRLQRLDRNHFDITLDVGQMQERVVVHGKGTAAAAGVPHRVRVGGNVVPAKVVYKVDPDYPEDARSRGVQGDVVLRAVVSMKGTVLSPKAVSSPDPQLTEAAIKAVNEWRYQPSLLNGEPIETATTITVNFQLEP